MSPAFHLSLSVADLRRTERFYVDVLGAQVGRRTEGWMDLWLLGAQVTAYERPGAVVPLPARNAMHFGATLEWAAWTTLADRLQAIDAPLRAAPFVDDVKGSAKLLVEDPDGYLVELKAYREAATLGRPPGA